jgi:hypothetical protein
MATACRRTTIIGKDGGGDAAMDPPAVGKCCEYFQQYNSSMLKVQSMIFES